MGAGVANLEGAREEGGFSTKDVSVVIKVSSPKSGRESRSVGWPCSSVCFARLKESGMGACHKASMALHSLSRRNRTHLGKIHAEGIHVHPIQETCEALIESA